MLIVGVLVDLDHYIFYVLKTKSFSPSRFYTFHKKLNKEKNFGLVKNDLYIFHSIEFIFLFGILSIFSDIIFLAWLGILVHRVVDLVYMKVLAKIWTAHSISIVGWFINRKLNKERRK
jgi:hypothetical protein